MKLNKITVQDAQDILKDDRKFSILVKNNSDFLRKIVWSYLRKNSLNEKDSEIFDDAYQEALLSLWKKALPKYNGSTKFSTFSYKVIKNDILAFLQNKAKFESSHGETKSIESLKRKKEDSSDSEYYEKNWKMHKNFISFETQIINDIDNQNKKNKLNSIDYKIMELKNRGWGRDKIAQALEMNLHTYKAYLYGSYIPKIKNLGFEYEE